MSGEKQRVGLDGRRAFAVAVRSEMFTSTARRCPSGSWTSTVVGANVLEDGDVPRLLGW